MPSGDRTAASYKKPPFKNFVAASGENSPGYEDRCSIPVASAASAESKFVLQGGASPSQRESTKREKGNSLFLRGRGGEKAFNYIAHFFLPDENRARKKQKVMQK